MKLSKLLKLLPDVRFMASTVDDVLYDLSDLGVTDLEVTKEQMFLIVQYYLATVRDDVNKAEVLREGKVDRIFGINLTLNEN